jgi:hypothetical protein
MQDNKTRLIKILDNTIIFFFIVFLLSLTDSIFINQVGYYGALLLFIARWFITKENPFRKSGLESAFLWFILAEFISLLLSKQQDNAVIFMLRRVLLIPIVYTTIAASFDIKRAKLYLKIYIGFSLISIIIYLGFSFSYLIYGLYNIKESGPSIFQYPITVSEITSFTVCILFAFLVNEKTSLRYKFFLLIAFSLSFLALISTYKRTGWTGAAFGILVILIVKRKWSILVPAVLALTILLFVEKNKSEITVYDFNEHHLQVEQKITTPGRAYDVLNIDSTSVLVSDYENGLLLLRNNKFENKISLPSPAISSKKWNDSLYVVNLIDTRFILLNRKDITFSPGKELLSSGYTSSSLLCNDYLYVLDTDSGLTVFSNPDIVKNSFRFPELAGYSGLYVSSSNIIVSSPEKGVAVYSVINKLPGERIAEYKNQTDISAAEFVTGKFITSGKDGLKLYKVGSTGLQLTYYNPLIKDGYKIFGDSGKIFILTVNRNLYETSLVSDSLKIFSQNKLDFTPFSASFYGGKFYFTTVKRSRLLSIFDPYNSSNFNRLAFWEAGIKMFKDHPLFGVGDIDLANLYRHYKHNYDKEIQGHLHNNFFHVLATLGLFGFCSVCFLFFKYLQISFKVYRQRKYSPFVSSFALGVIGSFCAFLVSGLTELNFWDHEIATLIWFLFGLNIAFFHLTEKKP